MLVPWPLQVSPFSLRRETPNREYFSNRATSPPPLPYTSVSLFNFYSLFFFLFHPQNSVAVASIHVPLAAPPVSSAVQSVDNSTCKLQFIVFRNGKLFPCTGNSSNLADDGKRRSVSTPVAFTKLGKGGKSIFIIMLCVCDVNAARAAQTTCLL